MTDDKKWAPEAWRALGRKVASYNFNVHVPAPRQPPASGISFGGNARWPGRWYFAAVETT